MPLIIDGKEIAKKVKLEVANKASQLSVKLGRAPCLAVVLVGDDPASHSYVKNKERAAKEVGIATKQTNLPANVTAEVLEKTLTELNNNLEIDAILLQLPLPKHLKSDYFLELISPSKDADGLHSFNQGELLKGNKSVVRPCTPSGVIRLIDEALEILEPNHSLTNRDISYAGKTAVVVGRSVLVGKPVALQLLERDATVFMAHSKTPNLSAVCQTADILVAACGQPNLINAEFVNPNCIVIDVGTTRVFHESEKRYVLAGDVDFESTKELVRAITPVPGGVGPMTVAMLLSNTVKLAEVKLQS
jgi:methylenetetrahydrofolate dehydrogenase (NADP+) / methenyltetrahydrofolate cyclohydrolase